MHQKKSLTFYVKLSHGLLVIRFKDNLVRIYQPQLITGNLFGIFFCLYIRLIVLDLSLLLLKLFLFLLKLRDLC